MANRYRLNSQPMVTLPANLSWTEDPVHDLNWKFQLHALQWVLDLDAATRQTGDPAYEARGIAIIQDWIHDNPRHGARSPWAWSDHATAIRAVVLTCTAALIPMTSWLRTALLVHGQTLADPVFYRREGNHALNQSIGLLEVGRILHRRDWIDLAGKRINRLVETSVDASGVTNEQAIEYELYNYKRYRQAEARMIAAGLVPSPVFARIDRMPAMLAQATLPNGTYEMIGDTIPGGVLRIPGTATDYAGSRGASGTRPTRTVAWYDGGFLFARSGWGEHRAPADETFLSARWGPAPIFHGHADGTAITLAGWGSRLLVDPGSYSYTPSPIRWFFRSRPSHNVVTVDGATWSWTAATRLLARHDGPHDVDLMLRASGYPGITQTRRVTWLRDLDVVVVDDRLRSATVHMYRQLWHFVEGANPLIDGSTVRTRRGRGNLLVRQLAGSPRIRIVTGSTHPIQGWISYRYGQKVAAPVEEAIQRGTNVRYLTLMVPSAARADASVSDLRITATGYSMVITVDGRSQSIDTTGRVARIGAVR